MKVVTPDWTRKMRMKIWTSGTEKTLIKIISPKKSAVSLWNEIRVEINAQTLLSVR